MSTQSRDDDNELAKGESELAKGEYVDSTRRGYDPSLRKYRVFVYTIFGIGFTWFSAGMLLSVIDYLFFT